MSAKASPAAIVEGLSLAHGEAIQRPHGLTVLELERMYFESRKDPRFQSSTVNEDYLNLLHQVQAININHQPDFFYAWGKVRNWIYDSQKLAIQFDANSNSMLESLTSPRRTSSVGETFLLITLFQDSDTKEPVGWKLGVQSFRDRLRPVLYQPSTQKIYDLATGSFGTAKSIIYSPESIYSVLVKGLSKEAITDVSILFSECFFKDSNSRPNHQPAQTDELMNCGPFSTAGIPDRSDNLDKARITSADEDEVPTSRTKMLHDTGAESAGLFSTLTQWLPSNTIAPRLFIDDESVLLLSKLAENLNLDESHALLASIRLKAFSMDAARAFSVRSTLLGFGFPQYLIEMNSDELQATEAFSYRFSSKDLVLPIYVIHRTSFERASAVDVPTLQVEYPIGSGTLVYARIVPWCESIKELGASAGTRIFHCFESSSPRLAAELKNLSAVQRWIFISNLLRNYTVTINRGLEAELVKAVSPVDLLQNLISTNRGFAQETNKVSDLAGAALGPLQLALTNGFALDGRSARSDDRPWLFRAFILHTGIEDLFQTYGLGLQALDRLFDNPLATIQWFDEHLQEDVEAETTSLWTPSTARNFFANAHSLARDLNYLSAGFSGREAEIVGRDLKNHFRHISLAELKASDFNESNFLRTLLLDPNHFFTVQAEVDELKQDARQEIDLKPVTWRLLTRVTAPRTYRDPLIQLLLHHSFRRKLVPVWKDLPLEARILPAYLLDPSQAVVTPLDAKTVSSSLSIRSEDLLLDPTSFLFSGHQSESSVVAARSEMHYQIKSGYLTLRQNIPFGTPNPSAFDATIQDFLGFAPKSAELPYGVDSGGEFWSLICQSPHRLDTGTVAPAWEKAFATEPCRTLDLKAPLVVTDFAGYRIWYPLGPKAHRPRPDELDTLNEELLHLEKGRNAALSQTH